MIKQFLGYGRQSIAREDIDAVVDVLQSDRLTQGPVVDRFERALADYVSARYAVAVANGTAALHLACLAAGLATGKRAVTQAVTFVATANSPIYCGASVETVDVDPETLGMNTAALRRALSANSAISVVLPTHMAGWSVDPAAIASAAVGRLVIEDACHALGGREPEGTMVGGCRHSAMTCFSFHPVKSITTAEGGAITTNDVEFDRLLRSLRSHGIESSGDRFVEIDQAFHAGSVNPWYYEQQRLGFNYRLTDIQAALGLSQLARIEQFMQRRRELARYYDEYLKGLPGVRTLHASEDARRRSSHHLYLLDIDFAAIGKPRSAVMQALAQQGVGSQVHYIPLYRQPYHRGLGSPAEFPGAERYYRGCLSIPMHAALTDEAAARVARAIKSVLAR